MKIQRLRTLALLTVIPAFAACGNPSGPGDPMTGTWEGTDGSIIIRMTLKESDAIVTGTGTVSAGNSWIVMEIVGSNQASIRLWGNTNPPGPSFYYKGHFDGPNLVNGGGEVQVASGSWGGEFSVSLTRQ
jgi:hypothetical protein